MILGESVPSQGPSTHFNKMNLNLVQKQRKFLFFCSEDVVVKACTVEYTLSLKGSWHGWFSCPHTWPAATILN